MFSTQQGRLRACQQAGAHPLCCAQESWALWKPAQVGGEQEGEPYGVCRSGL